MAVGLEERLALHQLAQILHLCAIGRDDTHVDAFFQNALLADFLEIEFQHGQREQGLLFVDAPERLAHKFLAGVNVRGVYPFYRLVVV